MQKVLITGTGRGIGLATADKFLEQGYFVIGTSTTGQAPIINDNFECYKLDLRSEFDIDFATQEIFAKHPNIDFFINNAGVASADESEKPEKDILRNSLEVNLIGAITFTEKALEHIPDAGKIVFLGSTMGRTSNLDGYDYPSYRISKAGLHTYAKMLSMRLATSNIKVIVFHPGWIQTAMGGEQAPKTPKQAADDLFVIVTDPNLQTGTFWDEKNLSNW